jgi:hypothetical protein
LPGRLDFEIKAPGSAAGTTKLKACALYYVCEDLGGMCLFLRQDISLEIDVPWGIICITAPAALGPGEKYDALVNSTYSAPAVGLQPG